MRNGEGEGREVFRYEINKNEKKMKGKEGKERNERSVLLFFGISAVIYLGREVR